MSFRESVPEGFCGKWLKTSATSLAAAQVILLIPLMNALAVNPIRSQALILAQHIRHPPTLSAIQIFLATRRIMARIG